VSCEAQRVETVPSRYHTARVAAVSCCVARSLAASCYTARVAAVSYVARVTAVSCCAASVPVASYSVALSVRLTLAVTVGFRICK
jgi:hypothetical protein